MLGLGERSQQDDEGIGLLGTGADPADQFNAVHSWHHPVGDDQKELAGLKAGPGLFAVLGGDDLVPPLLQLLLELKTGNTLIFGNQNLHSMPPYGTSRLNGPKTRDERAIMVAAREKHSR